MTAVVDADRIRAITALLDVPGPAKQPAPTGPGTRTCITCGHPDRLLIPTGLGTWVCLNIDRCQP